MSYAWQSVEEAAVTLGVSTRTLHRRISRGEVETRLQTGRREVLVCLPDEEEQVEQGEMSAEVGTEVADREELEETPLPVMRSIPPVSQGGVMGSLGTMGNGQAIGEPGQIVVAEKEIALANERVRRTELALVAFQHTTELLQREASRTRISARVAWAAVALLAVGVYVAVGWTASRVTRATADKEHLSIQLGSASEIAEKKAAEAEKWRAEAATAREAAAKSAGELAVTQSQAKSLEAAAKEANQRAREALEKEATARAQLSAMKRAPTTQPGIFERMVKGWGLE